MMADDWLTHLATNGAGTIHDWEYAWLGRSTESVRDGVACGRFGTWDETGRKIQIALLAAGLTGEGYGRALGRFIAEDGVTLPGPEALEEAIRKRPGASADRGPGRLAAGDAAARRGRRTLCDCPSLETGVDSGRRLPPRRAHYRPSRHRLRHHHQPSDVQRGGDRPGRASATSPSSRRPWKASTAASFSRSARRSWARKCSRRA